MNLENALDVLNLKRNEINEDKIKRARKEAALKCHPDRGGLEDAMKLVNSAYEFLLEESKREDGRVYKEYKKHTCEKETYKYTYREEGIRKEDTKREDDTSPSTIKEKIVLVIFCIFAWTLIFWPFFFLFWSTFKFYTKRRLTRFIEEWRILVYLSIFPSFFLFIFVLTI